MTFKEFIKEAQEYSGEHEAPDRTNGQPIYNVVGIYPEDIYGNNSQQYIQIPEDTVGLNIIHACRNKPRYGVKIYRAIPKIETPEEIQSRYNHEKWYILKYGKLPETIDKLSSSDLNNLKKEHLERYNSEGNLKSYYLMYIEKKLNEKLPDQNTTKPLINKGDWVTPSKAYAINHGKENLNNKFRILSKTVKAAQLFTDGNSLSEWGYDP